MSKDPPGSMQDLPGAGQDPPGAGQDPRERLYYLDHLRAALVVLVVLHHLALVYGAAAPFYYQEPPFGEPVAAMLLAVFVLVNQSWFMGALFLLAGYFAPAAVDRKGPRRFLRGRLVRLGLPVLAGIFVLEPVSRLGFFLMPAGLTGITAAPTWSVYPELLGLGPLWFALLLLIFDTGYAAWRLSTKTPPPARRPASPPGYRAIAVFVLALAAASYLVRIVVPLGREVTLFAYFLNFPTMAYLPQYLAFFVLGIAAYRLGWLRTLPGSLGAAGVIVAAAATALLFPPAVGGRLFSFEFADPARFLGGGHWSSAVYALWDSAMAVGLCLGAVVLFRLVFDGQGRFGRFVSRHGYAVYVIHVPIVVYLAFLLRDIGGPALVKFALAAAVAVPACFAAAYLVRRIPLASRVL